MTLGRAAGLAAAGMLAAAIAGVLVWRLVPPGDGPYAELYQAASQPIPGTLGLSLEPPSDGPDPGISPARARRDNPVPEGGEVHVTLATVRDRFTEEEFGPAWVLFARGVCLRDAKGELVSDARGNDPLDLECTDATMWVLAVDIEDGEPILAATGWDESLEWRPDVVGPAAA
jgi:hypothetical protein